MQGLRRLLQAKAFTPCDTAREALEAYRKESNSVLMFIEEYGLEPGSPADREALKDLYNAYNFYCKSSGYYPMGKSTFNKQMQAQGFSGGRDSKGMYLACKGFADADRI